MTVSTRLAVMNEGRVAQIGPPQEVYETPTSRYVAEFIGDVNILEAEIGSGASGRLRLAGGGAPLDLGPDREGLVTGPTHLALRPEKIAIETLEDGRGPEPNTLDGMVEDIAYLGDMSIYHVRPTGGGGVVRVARTNRFRALEQPISWETRVRLSWDGKSLVVLTD